MPPKSVEIVAISIRQPFAAACLESDKIFENRGWLGMPKYRGPLYIHSSRWESRPPSQAIQSDPWLAPLWDSPSQLSQIIGAIIGRVDLIAAGTQDDMTAVFLTRDGRYARELTPNQRKLLDVLPIDLDADAWRWWDGGGALIFANPQILETPLLTGGKLGLWRYSVSSDRLTFSPVRQKKRHRHRRRGRLDDPGDE